MKANVKEMSFAELNAMMNVIAVEIENRKEQAVSNYRQALAQLAEMGIEPSTITPPKPKLIPQSMGLFLCFYLLITPPARNNRNSRCLS